MWACVRGPTGWCRSYHRSEHGTRTTQEKADAKDTTGTGHRSCVIGETDARPLLLQLPN